MRKTGNKAATILRLSVYGIIVPLVASLAGGILYLITAKAILVPCGTVLTAALLLFIRRKKLDNDIAWMYGILLAASTAIITGAMLLSDGSVEGQIIYGFTNFMTLLFPGNLLLSLVGRTELVLVMIIASYATGFAVVLAVIRPGKMKMAVAVFVLVAVMSALDCHLYLNRPAAKYSGHGFDYMNGYSSTDLTDYTVYAENSKLVELDRKASLQIAKEADMPVMDGAEACYPLYAAFAKAVYKDIGDIEKSFKDDNEKMDTFTFNGKIVSFTNTVNAFYRLISSDRDKIDLFFGARPSREQMEYAAEEDIELEITPIGKEAFVFFTEEDNPVDSLTADEIRQIYTGDITNWKEVDGKDEEIVAFQRPAGSGSQTMMVYFMGENKLKEPKTYETVDAMSGVINEVAQYNDEAGALGYSFRYFLEELNQEGDVKLLAIDGTEPSIENIENGKYPLVADLCLVTRKNDSNPNVQKMKEFILSEDGQEIIKKTGYSPLS